MLPTKTTEISKGTTKKKGKKMKTTITIAAVIATMVSIVAIVYATGDTFKNEQLTRESWRSLEANNYEDTIVKAEECVTLFHDEALLEQQLLEKEGATVPKGRVVKEEKEKIFKKGLLNDVATCWFILGKAHAAKGNKELAEKAFKKALLFSYARCYDPSDDSFWAPSDVAKVELKKLSGKSIYD
ncbi:MAG: tetratricopeptide repeat protein [Colwellia sp.]|nr:tetratricopeptide repeat protein [Colwellia sp.]